MSDEKGGGGDREAFARAQETIAWQAREIERLENRLGDERFAEDLREALALASAAGTIASPVSHTRLLEMIVETAANVIFARAAALFLIDEEAEELIFEVALGSKAEEVKKFRVPLGHGIAGFVALSGQPMAVTGEDHPRQPSDIAEKVGYKPKNLLCVPLFYHDQIIGVLELLDKEGADSFSPEDMRDLGFFANQAAVAIEQSRINRNLSGLLNETLRSIGEDGIQERAAAFANGLEEDPAFRQALELARLVQEIAHQGQNELEGCRAILAGFAEYLRSKSEPMAELGGLF